MKYRSWFFSTPATTQGTRFNTQNKPTRKSFWELFASIPFFLEPDSEATETQQGLIKKASNAQVIARTAGGLATLASQIPEVKIFTTEDDTSEIYSNGIGITKEVVGNRENIHIKFRSDALAPVSSADENESYVVISMPNTVIKKDKSKLMRISKFISEYITATALTTAQVNVLIDNAISALVIPPADIDAVFEPPMLFKLGTAAATGGALFVPRKNGVLVSLPSTNSLTILEQNDIVVSKTLVGQYVKVTVDSFGANKSFGDALVEYDDGTDVYTKRLYAVYIPGVVGESDPGTPALTYTLEVTPVTLAVTVDSGNNVISGTKKFIGRVKDSNGNYCGLLISSISATATGQTFFKSLISPTEIEVEVLTSSQSATISVFTTGYSTTPVDVTLTRTVETPSVYSLSIDPAGLNLVPNESGYVYPHGVVTISAFDGITPINLSVNDIVFPAYAHQIDFYLSGRLYGGVYVVDVIVDYIFVSLITITGTYQPDTNVTIDIPISSDPGNPIPE